MQHAPPRTAPIDLVLLGASVRAAARSAQAAGLRPGCVDLFADADLAAFAPCVRINDFERDAERALASMPPAPWIYTGGLENSPDLVARLASVRPLLGTGADSLRRVRDPFQTRRALRSADCRTPRMAPFAADVPSDGTWLVKRRRSSGGLGVDFWLGPNVSCPPADCYFQQFLSGPATSAVFVAARGRAVFRGATRQYTGRFGAGPFNYCGSVGPLRPSPERLADWERIGSVLASEFGLVGVFGVDAIVHYQRPHVVDVNPRWPASAEVLEESRPGWSIMAEHVAACRDGRLPDGPPPEPTCRAGKAILFADRSFVVSSLLSSSLMAAAGTKPPLCADVPAAAPANGADHSAAASINAGDPICTVFGRGATLNEADRNLVRNLKKARRWVNVTQKGVVPVVDEAVS